MTKTNTRNRIVSILLVLMMLLTMVPITGVTASAAEWTTVNTYEEWKEKMELTGDKYIKLGADIDTSKMYGGYGLGSTEFVSAIGRTYLDLNGKKLTLKKSIIESGGEIQFIRVTAGELIIKDSKGGGEIVGVNNVTRRYMRLIDVVAGAKLTLNSGRLHLETAPDNDVPNATICSMGTVEINGGTVSISKFDGRDEATGQINMQNFALETISVDGCYALINGGTFDGRVLLNAVAKASGVADNVITGGDFKKSIYIQKDKDVTGDVPLNVSIQGGTYHYTPGYYTRHANEPVFPGRKQSDPSDLFQFSTQGFTEEGVIGDGPVYNAFRGGSLVKDHDKYDMNAFASMFPKNAIITAEGQEYDHLDVRDDEPTHIIVNDAAFTGSSSALDLAHLVDSHYKTITVTTLPEDALKDMKLTVGDGTPLPAKGNSTVYGDVTLGSDGTLTKNVYISAIGNKQLKEMYYSNPSKIDFGYRLNIFKDGKRVDYTGVISQTYAVVGDEISVSVQLPNFKFEEGVYTFRLGLHSDLRGSEAQVGKTLVGLWKLTAEKEPPAPVAHSIKITNGRGTASTTSAFAGETVTVTAKDDTANYMMFTQWYAKTAGVTFADATKQETTFVMPDCDVEVNPGFQQVSFTNQPTSSWLSSVDDSKVYFAFSQPITSWKLVNEDNTTLASGNAESAKALVAATLGPKPDKTEMTCRVIVTSNGQNFTSRTFDLKWYNVPGAPDVTVYPEGGKFVETLDVKLETPNTYWGIAYTTDGSDPYDKSGTEWLLTPSAKIVNDSTQVTINKDTTIKACLYNYEGYSNMEKFGDIVTRDFTKVELTPPVADPPSGTSFYDSLNVSLSTDIVNAKIMLSYNNGDVDDLSDPNQWKEYEPEKESITLSGSYGMHGFDAVTGIQMEHPDGYTYWVHSDKQEYLYPRISYATIADASVVGKVNKEITPVDVSITLSGDVFAEDLTAGTDVSGWFTNLPAGLTAKVKERTNYTATLVITISGTPTATSAAAISVEMPKSALRYTGTGTAVELTVLSNPNAVYNIVEDGTHTHNYGDWTMLDDSQHSRSCTACGDVQFEAHEFTPWTDNGNGTHSRHCTVCKMTDGSTYTETAEHTWVWVVDQEAALDQPGKQHEECTGCHAKRSENTEIPALRDYAVTVTGGTATVAAGTPITRAMEGVEVTVTADAPEIGKVFDKWVVLEGSVTLADATKATTTFTMPASAVKLEATYKDAPPSHTHSYGTDWKYDDTNHWHSCQCGDKADIAAHSASEWIVDTAATETADGAKHKECTVCKKVLETETIPATGSTHTHSYGTDWKYDDTNHWHECQCGDKADTAAHSFQWVIDKAATKDATGIKHEECTVCGAKRSENTVIDKLPDGGNTGTTGSGDNNTDKPGKDDSTKSPQTGDSNNLIGWLAALFVSGGVLTVLSLNGKKRKESEAE